MPEPLAADRSRDPLADRRRRYPLLAALMLGLLLAELDQAVFATALPTVVGDLAGVDQLLWVNTSYVLTATLVVPVAGQLGDQLGRRRVFASSLLVLLAGSVVGGLAPNMSTLIAARAVQGLGGGGLLVLVQAAIADMVPARRRAPVMSAVDAVFALAAVTGPVLGGWLSEGVGWRWAFWLNLPIGAAAVAAALALLPRRPAGPRPRVRIDLSGAVALFRARDLTLAVVAGLVLGVAMFGTVGYLPTFLQMASGLSPTRAGLMMLTLVAGLAVATLTAAQVVARTGGTKTAPLVGAALVGVALLLLATLSATTPLPVVGAYLFALGAGTGCAWEVLVVVVQEAAPPEQTGLATAVNGFVREVGVLLGSAGVGAAFTALLGTRLAGLPAAAGSAQTLTPERLAGLAPGPRAAVAHAYAGALTPVFAALVPLVGIAVVALALIRPARLSTGGGAN